MTPSTRSISGGRAAALAIVATLALAACSAAASPASGAKASAAPGDSTSAVDVATDSFAPADLTVAQGTTVTWTNKTADTHTVTGTNGATFDSGNLFPAATFQQTFATAGTFTYMCVIHPEMTGTVTVTASVTPSAAPSSAH